ncbi:hypothetical protein Q1695_002561 [Nippostrongylus brasiliensis]|nr:hypothetical protein Q1695_002561 [Nippostrongylus brasiliensis]
MMRTERDRSAMRLSDSHRLQQHGDEADECAPRRRHGWLVWCTLTSAFKLRRRLFRPPPGRVFAGNVSAPSAKIAHAELRSPSLTTGQQWGTSGGSRLQLNYNNTRNIM